MKEYLEIAKVVAVFGIKGEFRVQYFCDNADVLCSIKTLYFENGTKAFKVKRAFPHKNTVVLGLEGIDSPELAQSLMNKMLFAKRRDFRLKRGEYFIQDLIGMTVVDADDGKTYGKITDVLQSASTDVYTVTDDLGREILFPAIKSVVIDTNIKKGIMQIRPMEGLLEIYLDENQGKKREYNIGDENED